MKTVVLCIDRDNDVGEKAGIKGPVIGRKDNLMAAMKLALADPEDTDLNTIFAAVKVYDRMKAEGRDVEVVTVLGDRSLGLAADEKISHQIDVIVQVLKVDSAVIVTDGAEDEGVLPIIQSRLKIIHVGRVVVKSLPTGKETVSILRNYLREERFRYQFILPIGLAFITYFVFVALQVEPYFFPALTLVIGAYLMMTALNVAEALHGLGRTLRVGVATSRLSVFGNVVAAFVVALGAAVSAQFIVSGSTPFGLILPRGQAPSEVGGMLVAFALLFSPVLYLALMTRLLFRVADFRLRRGKHSGGLTLRFLPVTGYFMVAWGVAGLFAWTLRLTYGFGFGFSAGIMLLGAAVVSFGAIVDRRFKDRISAEAEDASA